MKRTASLVAAAAATLVAAVAAQADDVINSHSGWAWGSPKPQGATLRALEFAGTRGYAAGELGTLLRTDDGGRSWTGLRTGALDDITRLRAIDADSVVAAAGCELLRSDDAGATFSLLVPAPAQSCGSSIASFHFPSEQAGFVVLGDGSVLATADAGRTFAARQALPGTAAGGGAAGAADAPTDVFFTDAQTGFATLSGPNGGRILRTADGGASWIPAATSAAGLNGVFFPDASIGFAVGNDKTLLKSTDGGESWDARPAPGDLPAADFASIRCATTTNCLIATASGERAVHITGGNTRFTSLTPSARKIHAFGFTSPSGAVGVGERGATVLSTNADAPSPSFVPVGEQPLSGDFRRLRAGSAGSAWAPGDSGRLARTNDGGHSWDVLQVPTSERLADAWFVDSNNGFVLDAGGALQRTTNGGTSWGVVSSAGAAKPRAVYAVDATRLILVGPAGVLRSSDGGTTFSPATGKAARASLVDYDRTDGLALYAYGRRSLVVSNDLGVTWRRVKNPIARPRYRKVDFVNGKLGFALTAGGRVFRTPDGGRHWRELHAIGSDRLDDLSFGDTRNGYLTTRMFGRARGDHGWVLRTSDAGATWRPQLVAPSPLVGVAAGSPDAAFGLTSASDFLYTNSGGDRGATSAVTLKPKVRKVTRTQRVKLSGRLKPAVPGATVVVSARNAETGAWSVIATPAVSASGSFVTSVRVRKTTQLVAQWRGDAAYAGDGSGVATIARKPRRR